MELFDLYDDDRIPLGKTIERGNKCGEGENRQVIHICIFNSKNEMLIQKRQVTKGAWANYWDLSVGGCSIAGETSKQSAERELFEELGIEYDFSKERPYLTLNFENGFDDYYFLKMEFDPTTLTLQESEVSDARWASLDEILKLLDEGKFVTYARTFLICLFELKDQRGVRRS